MPSSDTNHRNPHRRVDPIGPTPLTDEYVSICRTWYAEGRSQGPRHAELIDASAVPWGEMSAGEIEYASAAVLRVERELYPRSGR